MTKEISSTDKDYGLILEKVIINNDLVNLSPVEKVQHIKNICESLGLNPLTKPIQLLKFQGKEVMYFSRDSTDQLRKIHNISVVGLDKVFSFDNSLYIVTAHLETPDGRKDQGTGAVFIKGLSGEPLCNAIMKAESKAKRRGTLSICGLGFAMDESETESIPNAVKVDPYLDEAITQQFDRFMTEIEESLSLEKLQSVWEEIKKFNFKNHKNLLELLIKRKDEIKQNIQHVTSIAS